MNSIDHLTFKYEPGTKRLICIRDDTCDNFYHIRCPGQTICKPGQTICKIEMEPSLYQQIKKDKFKWAIQNLQSEHNRLRELAHDIIFKKLEIE